MRIATKNVGLPALALISGLLISAPARGDQLSISVVNDQPSGGFAFSPVWLGLHDGSYTSFGTGDNLKGSPLQSVAELANTGPITAAFLGKGPETTVGSAPIGPGGSASGLLNVADPATDRFLNYASMVVPSNDFFFGNDAAHRVQLFNSLGQLIDDAGQVTSARTIQIYGRQVWDAGTEINDITFGAAFIVGDNIADHRDENGTAQLVFGGPNDLSSYLNSIDGKATPYGYNISHLISPDDLIGTITLRSVPEPSSLALLGLGTLGLIGSMARRRRIASRSKAQTA